MSWQYNGAAKWQEIVAWCDELLGQDYRTNGHETIYFLTPEAQLVFQLRWSF